MEYSTLLVLYSRLKWEYCGDGQSRYDTVQSWNPHVSSSSRPSFLLALSFSLSHSCWINLEFVICRPCPWSRKIVAIVGYAIGFGRIISIVGFATGFGRIIGVGDRPNEQRYVSPGARIEFGLEFQCTMCH